VKYAPPASRAIADNACDFERRALGESLKSTATFAEVEFLDVETASDLEDPPKVLGIDQPREGGLLAQTVGLLRGFSNRTQLGSSRDWRTDGCSSRLAGSGREVFDLLHKVEHDRAQHHESNHVHDDLPFAPGWRAQSMRPYCCSATALR